MPPLDSRTRDQLKALWLIWGIILAGLGGLYVVFGRKPAAPTASLAIVLAAFGAMFISIVIRWLMLPRFTNLVRLTLVFTVGLALAESCGIIGLFLGGPYRDALGVLGVLGVVSYAPLFAHRLADPKPRLFVPNN